MSRHGPKDQSKADQIPGPPGHDKTIQPLPTAKKVSGGENKRQVSKSGGMTPSDTLGGYPTGV